MKLATLIVSLFLAAPCFAIPTSKATFTCVSQKTGNTIVAKAKYGEITVKDRHGAPVADLDGLHVRSAHLAGFLTTMFSDPDDGNEIIMALFEQGGKIGGEYYDDKSLSCTKK